MDKLTNPYKKCPRCNNKVQEYQKKCDVCGLIFSRLEQAKNCYAKKELLSFHKENVVYTKKLPSDVSRTKLIVYCALLGLFGAHNFYVGKYFKAFYMLVVGLMSFVISFLTYTEFVRSFVSFFFIFVGISVFMWGFDLIDICFKRFKVPVALGGEKE